MWVQSVRRNRSVCSALLVVEAMVRSRQMGWASHLPHRLLYVRGGAALKGLNINGLGEVWNSGPRCDPPLSIEHGFLVEDTG